MAQAKLTLRPPPNIDFVQGYPGIPPGAPDRPQAAVKGTIEVRLGPQGVKAKYVRVELRKIESLPGVPPNSYYDFVGQSPINLWQASEEYMMLHSQDIPFYIRIPESIPPTLALENGAGIKYELVGQVCIQGKSGFFRRNKPVILSSSTQIVIDKHELHSTWPVFQQHETRNLTQDAVMLTVDRSQNCYGPGDRVLVQATIRSDNTHPTILRGFEFTLKETTIFRAGPHVTGRSGAPQVKINIIGEQKVLANVTMHSGMLHRSDLAVVVPQNHTTTTLTSARHIDITYVLVVKALMGIGKPLIMELPVIVSNWPRYVSGEAVRRIGIAPSLSLQHPVVSMNSVTTPGTRPRTVPGASQAATVTATGYPYAATHAKDPRLTKLTNTVPSSPSAPAPSDEMGFIVRRSSPEGGEPQTQPQTEPNGSSTRRRSRAGSAVPQSNRFTVTNMTDNEIPEDGPHTNTPGLTETPSQTLAPQRKAWPTAEEEKARLYQEAIAKVERVQGGLDRAESVRSANGYPTQGSQQSSSQSAPPQVEATRWATAEEEKIRLFTQAQNNARIVQGYAQDSNDNGKAPHSRGASRDSSRSFQQGVSQGRPPVISAGAALYSHAMASVSKPSWGASVTTPSVPSPVSQTTKPPRLLTAAEEKEMLRRYHNATRAVQRHHEANFGPSDEIMPSTSSLPHDATSGQYPGDDLSGPAPDELPPPWVPSPEFSQTEDMSEKERYRIAYEARERASAAASAEQHSVSPSLASHNASPPADYYTAMGMPHGEANGSDPLRAAADGGLPPPWQPTSPGAQHALPPHLRARSPPVPPNPAQSGQPRMLSAAEEKALLKARFEAEEESASSPPITQQQHESPPSAENSSPIRSEPLVSRDQMHMMSTPPRTPPPLMPRPPASYIQETAEEDARLQGELANGQLSASASGTTIPTTSISPSVATAGAGTIGLDDEDDDAFGLLRPTSPFTIGWESIATRTGVNTNASANGLASSPSSPLSPPPLPPKVPLGH